MCVSIRPNRTPSRPCVSQGNSEEPVGDSRRRISARARLPTDDFAGVDPKDVTAMRREVMLGERAGIDRPQDGDGIVELLLLARAAGRIGEVDRAVYDHTLPVERTRDLVDLKRDPWMMLDRAQLGTVRRSRVDPSVAIDV